MKKYVILVLLCLGSCWAWAQQTTFKSSESKVVFFSSAPLEDITATNERAIGLFNGGTGAFAFIVPIKGFNFRKSLMQEHFNEKFMESDKYPRATFEGKLTGYELGAFGKQTASADGHMTIHGVTHKIQITGDFIHDGDNVNMKAVFPIKLEDYEIKIPRLLFQNIAEEVEVTVDFMFEPN